MHNEKYLSPPIEDIICSQRIINFAAERIKDFKMLHIKSY